MNASWRPHLGILITAWIIADLVMPILIRLSRRRQWYDLPHGHKTHVQPTPVLGGIGIYLALVGSLAFWMPFQGFDQLRPILGIFLGGTLVMLLGVIDDFRPINAVLKLAVLATATLVISRFGITISLLPGGENNPLNLLITLFWIVGLTSSTNSLDHANGTTAGSVAIACGVTFIIAWGSSAADSQCWLSYLSMAIGGGCLGFLRHNLNGGKIFLGDNGSFLLGFLMASSLVFARWSHDPIKALILPGVIMTVPIFDIVLSTVLRIKNGVVGSVRGAIVYCGKDHLFHRLAALGYSRKASLAAIYSMGIVAGGFALAIRGLESRLAYLLVLAAYLFLLVIVGLFLDRAPVHPRRAGRPHHAPHSPSLQRPPRAARSPRKRSGTGVGAGVG